MEYYNFTFDSEQFSLAELPILSNVPSPEDYFLTWADQSAASNANFFPPSPDGGTSSNNSRSASEAGLQSSPLEGNILQFSGEKQDDEKTSRRQSGPLETGDETTSQRILRRRTQNRNAQRSYRQRREDERKILEDKLKVVEDECRDLGKACTELNVVVEMQRDQLNRMEAENTALRTSMYSMPWRKGSKA